MCQGSNRVVNSIRLCFLWKMKGEKGGQQVKEAVKLWLALSALLQSKAGWRGTEQSQRNEENIKHAVKRRGRLNRLAERANAA